MTAAAAIGALILAASAAPALAGGYWDGGIVQGGQAEDPGPAYADRDCPCNCPSDHDRRGDWREQQRWGERGGYGEDEYRGGDDRGWSDRDYSEDRGDVDERVYDSGWQDQDAYDDEDYAPVEYSDNGYGVGPDIFIDEGGGGGEVGFAGAGAFAGADAFANVGVDVDIRDRFRDHDHFHDRDHDHHMHPPMHDHQYPQHQGYQHMGSWGGSWGSMQPHMMSGWGHMGGVGHPAMAHGGMVIHSGGGRRR